MKCSRRFNPLTNTPWLRYEPMAHHIVGVSKGAAVSERALSRLVGSWVESTYGECDLWDQLFAVEVLTMDIEGYGQRPGQTAVERLLEDSRTLSPAGIERAATGWDAHGGAASEHFRAAERAALRAVEASDRGAEWDNLRNQILGLTERGAALVAWRAEHGEVGHKAEAALLTAALALLGGERIVPADRRILVQPMAEALPWLLGDAPAE